MNPEEKLLLERSLKLSEENNKILRKMERRFRWAFLWGFIKMLLIVVPLIVGYFFLEPYLDEAAAGYQGIRQLMEGF
jgi:hypothetical protein